MSRKGENKIISTPFGILLDRYSLDTDALARDMTMYKLKISEEDSEFAIAKKRNKEGVEKYALKKIAPTLSTFFTIARLIGCSTKELFSVMNFGGDNYMSDLLEAQTALPILTAKNIEDDELQLIRQGYEYKCLRVNLDFCLDIVESCLELTEYCEIKIYKNTLTQLTDLLFYLDSQAISSIILDDNKRSLNTGNCANYRSICLGEMMWRGDKVEIKVKSSCERLSLADGRFCITEVLQPTDLLQISGTVVGLGDIRTIKFGRDRKIDTNNYEKNLPSDDFLEGLHSLFLEEKRKEGKMKGTEIQEVITLDENSHFQIELKNLSRNSIFSLDWEDALKK